MQAGLLQWTVKTEVRRKAGPCPGPYITSLSRAVAPVFEVYFLLFSGRKGFTRRRNERILAFDLVDQPSSWPSRGSLVLAQHPPEFSLLSGRKAAYLRQYFFREELMGMPSLPTFYTPNKKPAPQGDRLSISHVKRA
jgi:hypothetical protein